MIKYLLVTLLSLTATIALSADKAAITLVPPLAQDRRSFGAFGYPNGGLHSYGGGYGYSDGYAAYGAGIPCHGTNQAGFYTGVPLGQFGAAYHPYNFHVDLDHSRRLAEQLNNNAARFSQQYIELMRCRSEAEAKALIVRSTFAGAAQVASQAQSGCATPQGQTPTTSPIPAFQAQGAAQHVASGQQVLINRCYKCHSGNRIEAGLDLTDAKALTPAKWDTLLGRAHSNDPEVMMPPETEPRLTTNELGLLFELRAHLRDSNQPPPLQENEQ